MFSKQAIIAVSDLLCQACEIEEFAEVERG